VNDGFADICEKYPDYFPGWVAQAPLTAPDAGVREVTRAIKNGRSVCRSTPMSLESRSTIRPSSRSTPP
jgi:predicted TIM-barrel fold metal-dependent hydrolase